MPGKPGGLYNTMTQLAAAPAPAPVLPEPLPPSPEPRPPRRWPFAVVLIVVALGSFLAWRWRATRSQQTQPGVRTATVMREDFVPTLRLTGLTAAVRSHVIAAPSLTGGGPNSLVITHMVPAGTHVKQGDLLVVFDPQNQIKTAQDKEADYRDFLDQIEKKKADQAAARAKDDTELKQAEDAVSTAEWEVRRNEVLSKIDAEKNVENLDGARAQLEQLRQTYQLKRAAAAADLKMLEIERDRARNDMLHAQNNARQMEIRSPMDGVVVLNMMWRSGTMAEVQEGDEVRAGMPFMQVVDPSLMQTLVRANQSDAVYLKPGQMAQLHLDAYPGLTLPARLESLDNIAVTSMAPKVRVFSAVFTILGQDPKLMPDLSAALDVELGRIPNATIAPRDAVVAEGGKSYAWVRAGSGYQKREVTVGSTSDMEAEIRSGLKEGEVVLRNPENAPGVTR